MPDETAAVYAAEDLYAEWLDRASRSPGDPVRVRVGATVQAFEPEVEPRFSDPEHVQAYVDRVLDHLAASGASYADRDGRDLTGVPVRVRRRRGRTRAVYESDELPERGVIALPSREVGGRWSLRAAVVLHEVAHHLSGGEGHGPGFRTTHLRLLEDLGLPVQADLLHTAYRQQGLDTGIDGADRTLLRIGRLLRQAERTDNAAERDTFFAKAQDLATRHQIALAVARATAGDEERREDPAYETVHVGERGKRALVRYVRLLVEIARVNDLQAAIYSDNTRVTLYGFPSDITIVKALYASLVTQMVADGDAHLRSGAHRVGRAVHGSTARAAFYEAWTEHVADRLAAARAHARQQSEAVAAPASVSTEVALRAKEVEVVDYFSRMKGEHGVRGTWKGAAYAGAGAPESWEAGAAAAARARLGTEQPLPSGR
jgi:putative metallohydrolase (TIGR04338 family)